MRKAIDLSTMVRCTGTGNKKMSDLPKALFFVFLSVLHYKIKCGSTASG
jgi:hypothetical protein